MDSTLFAKIVEAVNVAEDTELPGCTKRIMVQHTIQDIMGGEYQRYEPMIGIAIDAIVDIRKREIAYLGRISRRDSAVVEVHPTYISRRRSFLASLCCL
jgi:hypothetical protein